MNQHKYMSEAIHHVPNGPKSTWITQANEIIARGYPAVDALLPELVAWLKDINWPGAQPIAEFLVSIGSPVVPHVKSVLQEKDRVWQYFVLNWLVDQWPREMVAQLVPELMHLIWLTDGEEVDIAALRQLAKHRLGDCDKVSRAIALKQQTYRSLLSELDEIEQYMKTENHA